MLKRKYRVVSTFDDVRATSFATLEKAQKKILSMIKGDGFKVAYIKDTIAKDGFITYVTTNSLAYVIVDMARREQINQQLEEEYFKLNNLTKEQEEEIHLWQVETCDGEDCELPF